MEKLLVYDLETTGLDSERHGIWQLGGVIIINGKIVDTINIKMNPFTCRNKVLSKSLPLLEKQGMVKFKKTIRSYYSYKNGFKIFTSILSKHINRYDKSDKFTLVGFNNKRFDDNFIRQFFLDNNNKYIGSYFWSDTVDVMPMASWKLRKKRHTMKNFKLSTVARKLGIKVKESKLHDASYDVDLTLQILKKVMPKWRNNI